MIPSLLVVISEHREVILPHGQAYFSTFLDDFSSTTAYFSTFFTDFSSASAYFTTFSADFNGKSVEIT